ncbi:NirA family protein [Pacificoceanicola onchidii]|uniref:NirA family protein n=1 Tax=Pacificoceanicola onchidii TaxID=2562685 RepID=UPI001455DD06|nr:NirA family protein [Pacificoceanicola onchidii]
MSQAATGFTSEQQSYLIDVLTKLNLNQAFQAGGGSGAAEEATVYGVPLEDLAKEEVAKYNMHPLDMWHMVEAWEAEGHQAAGLDNFLLRHLGFFDVRPAQEGYMMRMRCPGNILRGDQMSVMGEIAEAHAGGYSHVTTRGSLQLREIMPGNIIPIIEKMQAVGLTAQGTGADSARNLTVSPLAGVDPLELIDLRPQVARLSLRILRTRELQGIPRKFNISFDGAGHISCVSDTNDICFQAVEIGENEQGIEPGIWLRIALGGITGHKDFARATELACRPEEAVDVAEAMLRVFVEHGNRRNRAKARLKYLLDGKGVEWFCQMTQEKLDAQARGVALHRLPDSLGAPRPPIDRRAHIGIHKQKNGLNYVGVALELGRMSAEQMRELGRIAMTYGDNDLRLTVWQNPLILGVSDENLPPLRAALAAVGLSDEASSFAAGAVACTGKWACKLAQAYTKADALAIVRHLEDKFTLETPINIHLTGCPNSCAQHYIGDIGLVGTATPGGGEGYSIVLGGGSDMDQGLARPLCGPVPGDAVIGILDHVIGRYIAERAPDQTFLDYTRSLSDEALQSLVPQDMAIAS